MVTREEALALLHKELRTAKRLEHSLAVARRMEHAAAVLGADVEEWYLTGLLHDIDLELTKADMAKHGILARNMLEGLLPPDALMAIEAHDHRTGAGSDTRLARALRFADVLENLLGRVPAEEIDQAARSGEWESLMRAHADAEDRLIEVRDFLLIWPSVGV
jgi:uncharacterized protein